jgi:hypothetical protein
MNRHTDSLTDTGTGWKKGLNSAMVRILTPYRTWPVVCHRGLG